MHIDWASLAEVGVVAAAATLTVVLLMACAVVSLSTRSGERVDGDHRSGPHPATGTAVAGLCVLAAGLIVCYGLYLIIA
jgi:hypothetical protein